MGTSNMAATAGHALLVSKTTNVTNCSDAAIVDKVGYGASATCPEGGSGKNAPSPGSGLSTTRRPGGTDGSGQDTDVNSDDFMAAATPVFHNRSSAVATPPVALGNVGNSLYLDGTVSGATLSWANAAGATAYRVYRGTTPDYMSAAPSPWATVTSSSSVDASLPATIYFYVVRATNGTIETQ
jgi:hypothetical protein